MAISTGCMYRLLEETKTEEVAPHWKVTEVFTEEQLAHKNIILSYFFFDGVQKKTGCTYHDNSFF